jgi:hypothetical protein
MDEKDLVSGGEFSDTDEQSFIVIGSRSSVGRVGDGLDEEQFASGGGLDALGIETAQGIALVEEDFFDFMESSGKGFRHGSP